MSELIKTIERMGNMEKWYEIILGNFIDRKNSHSFSDYEMYARYMENNYSYRMHVIDQGADLSFSIFQPSRNRLLFLPPRYRQFHAILACIACWFGFSGISYPSHIDSISYLWRR